MKLTPTTLPANSPDIEGHPMRDQFSNTQTIRKSAVTSKGGIVAAQSGRAAQVGAEVLAAVARGLAVPEAEWPGIDTKRDIPRGVGAIADLLKVVLKMKCDEADVAQRLVASSEDVELIAALGDEAEVAALSGWRRQVFGDAALKVRTGALALVVSGKKLVLVPPEALVSGTEA